MMKELRWSQIILAFLLGSVLTAGILHQKREMFRSNPSNRYHRMLEKFSSRLDLTPEQKTQVAAIFGANRKKIDALRDEAEPKMEEIRRRGSEEIRKLLTTDQQKKFDRMEKEHADRRRSHRGRDDDGPPPPPR